MPTCDNNIEWLDEQRFILTVEHPSNHTYDSTNINIILKTPETHKNTYISLFNNSINSNIRVVFSSYSLTEKGTGFPDGLSDCSNITSCYSDEAKIKGRLHSVGGLVGYLSPIGNVNNCYVSKANIKVDDASQNRQCYGGLVGQSAGTISKSYVVQSSIYSCQQIGGLVGYTTAGSISKCFVKDTTVKGYDFCVGGITAALFSQAQIDSCYIKDSSISFTVQAYSNNYTLGGLVGSNTATITNCYMYNSTVSGKTNYGALIGSSEGSGTISNCFISNNYSRLIDNNANTTPLTYCFYNVNYLSAFNGKSWSAGAWSNFNTTSFPPQ
ncbi:MAG: hypothetical protein J6Z11_11895, partial [Candidatus Riflebacteria bacterium]|nr:hypothetical protein [Candidatus Riflebacteria bacterium]